MIDGSGRTSSYSFLNIRDKYDPQVISCAVLYIKTDNVLKKFQNSFFYHSTRGLKKGPLPIQI